MSEQEIGVVGLATMGMNLSRNLASHGARVAVYNRTRKRTDDFMSQHGSEGDFRSAGSFGELVRIFKPPRAILLMVKAGAPVYEGLDEDALVVPAGESARGVGCNAFHFAGRPM